jgi:hypothetical protein
MATKKYDPKQLDSDNDIHANDNHEPTHGQKVPVAAAAMGSTALTSLEGLAAALNGVATHPGGHSGQPTLLFKPRASDGTWMFGQKRTVPEEGSRWAIDPRTIARGYIVFGDGSKKLGERLLSISQPMIDPATLPDVGFEWTEQWAVNLKCLEGSDAGVEVTFKTTTHGGIEAVRDILLPEIRDRINGGQHNGKVAPIARFKKVSYQNDFGKQWKPVFDIVDWMPLDGPAPAPAPVAPPPPASPPPAEQPRRRRPG